MGVKARESEDQGFWWALPWALVSWLLFLWIVGYSLTRPEVEYRHPPAIEERLIELPVTPPVVAHPEATPAPRVMPHPVPIPPVQVAPPVQQVVAPTPVPVSNKSNVLPPPPPPVPVTPPSKSVTQDAGFNTHGVLAIVKPSTDIPDDMADEVAGMNVTARFHVRPDGSFTVELTQPSSDPALNQRVLATLKRWKFSPAVDAGMPMAATQDVTFSF